jgi:hypothetical protein
MRLEQRARDIRTGDTDATQALLEQGKTKSALPREFSVIRDTTKR